MKRKKILLMQESLQPPGGVNAVAVWMVEALKRDYSLSLLTWDTVEEEAINRFYGTSLNASDHTPCRVSPFIRNLIELDPNPQSIKKICMLMRLAKRVKNDYDILITATREADLGGSGIQYIHYPWFVPIYRKCQPLSDQSGIRTFITRSKQLIKPWRLISGYSFNRMKRNLTLVNSDFTGKFFERSYGIPTVTVYPPVPRVNVHTPWEKRENGFLCIGRIAPEKRIGRIISILGEVRGAGFDVHLHIIGNPGSLPKENDYYREICKRVQQNASWISIQENLARHELIHMIGTHRYGIHRMEEEPFGIAIAEMVRGGCIVFIPNNGGQVEIVGQEDRLLFSSNSSAVFKIIDVLKHSYYQQQLSHHLRSRQSLFSEDRFMGQIQGILEHALSRNR